MSISITPIKTTRVEHRDKIMKKYAGSCILATLALTMAASTSLASAKPKAYFDVVDGEVKLIVDDKAVEANWRGEFDAAEYVKSNPEAYANLQDAARHSSKAKRIYAGAVGAYVGGVLASVNSSNNVASSAFLAAGSVAFIGGLVWFVCEARDGHFSFIKGMNEYNGVYEKDNKGADTSSGFRITPSSLSYNF